MTALREELETFAAQLVAGRRCPVDLEEILAQLGVGLDVQRPQPGDPVGSLCQRAGRPVIVVYDDPGKDLRARGRFTLAHELGHWVLETWGAERPGSRREYWAREAECNAFAAALLIPGAAVDYIVRPRPATAGELYSRLRLVAERARVSTETACRRALSDLPSAAVWEARDAPSDRRDLAGVIRWAQGAEHFGMRRGVHVHGDHRVAGLLQSAAALRPGSVVERHLDDQRVIIERRRQSTLAVALMTEEDSGQQRLLDDRSVVAAC